ncbi:MAG: NADH-quinone oxidoreductase subunit NuoE [Elusimicrobiales bacterium]|jgi:NADH-quinone oxidoreductase subunit E|nr:NADH-quinone oxidoreductase subunit NuoE [Elusimicrobiales bacterium]NLH39985.1 NADH-quinone oxidoreductase subunit NuoE [Elusimicrobiota bacterium]
MKTCAKNVLKKFNYTRRDYLIPVLQEVQQTDGYISMDAIKEIAKHFKISSSKVYGVATFYNQFRFEPKGKYHVMVCRGTACHVKGSLSCLNMVEEILKIKAGKTTKDGLFSIETVACMGACGLAPVVNINGEFYASMTPDKLKKLIDDIKKKESKNGKE